MCLLQSVYTCWGRIGETNASVNSCHTDWVQIPDSRERTSQCTCAVLIDCEPPSQASERVNSRVSHWKQVCCRSSRHSYSEKPNLASNILNYHPRENTEKYVQKQYVQCTTYTYSLQPLWPLCSFALIIEILKRSTDLLTKSDIAIA